MFPVLQDTFSTSTNAPGLLFWIVTIISFVFETAAVWTVFQKAGQPGWAAIVPIYNAIIWLKVAQKPVWWILLALIPGVNIIMAIIVVHNISKNFGHGVGFTLGIIFLSAFFIPLLAWGDSEYQPPEPQYQAA